MNTDDNEHDYGEDTHHIHHYHDSDNDERNQPRNQAESLKNITSLLVALVAVAGLVTSFFWTLSDFKVKDTELSTRLLVIEKNVEIVQKQLSDIDRYGSRNMGGIETTLKETRQQVEELRKAIEETRRSSFKSR